MKCSQCRRMREGKELRCAQSGRCFYAGDVSIRLNSARVAATTNTHAPRSLERDGLAAMETAREPQPGVSSVYGTHRR